MVVNTLALANCTGAIFARQKSMKGTVTKLPLSPKKGNGTLRCYMLWALQCPSHFARIMELVLSGLDDICLVYLHEILVFSRTFEEHCVRLTAIFDHLEWYTLKLKPTKCHLFQCKVTILGHVVSG